jgi:hypothetical protein
MLEEGRATEKAAKENKEITSKREVNLKMLVLYW